MSILTASLEDVVLQHVLAPSSQRPTRTQESEKLKENPGRGGTVAGLAAALPQGGEPSDKGHGVSCAHFLSPFPQGMSLVAHPHRKQWGKGTWGRGFSLAKLTLYKATQAAWTRCRQWVCKAFHIPLWLLPPRSPWSVCTFRDITSPLCRKLHWGQVWNSRMSCQQAKGGKQRLITLQVPLAVMQTSTVTSRTSGGKGGSLNGQVR